MGSFHYLVVVGESGGVERAPGTAIAGASLRRVLSPGIPALNIGLELIASLGELVAILEEDGCPHGALSKDCIHLDGSGILSIGGFREAADPRGSADDRYALGCLALELLGGGAFVSPGPRNHEDAVLDRLLEIDLAGLDGAFVGDVQWYLARLLDVDPTHRPDPVEVWRAFVAYAAATSGPPYAAWCARAVSGGGERRAIAGLAGASIGAGPLDGALAFGPVTQHGTAFLSKDQFRSALTGVTAAFGAHRAGTAQPRRTTGIALRRQDTVLRYASPTLVASADELWMSISDDPLPSVPDASTSHYTIGPARPVRDESLQAHELEAPSTGSEEGRSFQIERCLGRGGFGEVYLATQHSAGGIRSQVAVKVLREGLDPRAQALRRLRDEARVLAALRHPAILTAHDLVVLAERVAMVMEYVPGADLDVCLDGDDPPPLRVLLEILVITAEALDASHHAVSPNGAPLELVHRDIKPSNIRIGTHGQVKVLDFGIATFASDREAQTAVDHVVGTMDYMAPERLADSEDHPAGDVYALAIILLEALSGRSLWGTMPKREQYRMALVPGDHDAHIGGQIDDLDVSDGLKEVLRSALAHAPSARCTAAELARDLDDIAEACPGPTLRRWARAHTWPTPEALESELVGRRITEGRPVSSSSNAIGPGKVVARQIRRSPASPSVPAPPPRSIGVAELSPAASAPPAWRRSRTPSSGEPATSSSPLHWVVLVLVLLVALGGVALAGTGALALALTLR